MVEIVTPLLAQLGVGGVIGLSVGYALKKIGQLLAVILGLAFLGLEALAYKGIITINYQALMEFGRDMFNNLGALESVFTTMVSNLPFTASFIAGLALGLKM